MNTPKKIMWSSDIPPCALCQQAGRHKPGIYDVPTTFGPWADLCRKHMIEFGVNTGIGFERIKDHQS